MLRIDAHLEYGLLCSRVYVTVNKLSSLASLVPETNCKSDVQALQDLNNSSVSICYEIELTVTIMSLYSTLYHLLVRLTTTSIQGPPNLWQRTFWHDSQIKTKKLESLLQQLIVK